jgi:hypothetical protein
MLPSFLRFSKKSFMSASAAAMRTTADSARGRRFSLSATGISQELLDACIATFICCWGNIFSPQKQAAYQQRNHMQPAS